MAQTLFSENSIWTIQPGWVPECIMQVKHPSDQLPLNRY
jgi:hypothetical protein